jgi:hypothetical protein
MIAILVAIGSGFVLPRYVTVVIAVCAAFLLMLWMAHVIVFSIKSLAHSNQSAQLEAPAMSRRKLFGTFAKIATLAALSSAMPKMAFADSNCPNPNDHFCCRTNYGICCQPLDCDSCQC